MASTKYDTNKRRMTLPMFWIAGMGFFALMFDLISFGDYGPTGASVTFYSVLILMTVLMAYFAWRDSKYIRKDQLVMIFVLIVLAEALLEITGNLEKVGFPNLILDVSWISTGILFGKANTTPPE